MLTLIGVLIVVAGFAARLNPLLVVTVAALATGLASGLGPVDVITAFGKAFIESRYVAIVWLVLPVIGLLEHAGLKERARTVIAGIPAATTGRVLMIYFAVRQVTAALGLTSLGGQAQMVRPLVAPMAEGAAENRFGPLPLKTRHRIRAHAAAVDNIAVFFGEDIFIAIGSILLIKGFLEQNGIHVEPAQVAIWAVPTAVVALIIHIVRLFLLDRSLARELVSQRARRMITLEAVYWVMGLMSAGVAIVNLRDSSNVKRYKNALFWGLYAFTFLTGSYISHFASGCIVIVMVLVGGVGRFGQGTRELQTPREREQSAARWGNLLFIPALTIPVVTVAGAILLKGAAFRGMMLVDQKQITSISLGLATLVALVVGMIMLRPPIAAPLNETRRIWDSVGWAAVLPQMLAALGALFAAAGVGKVIAGLAGRWIPLGSPLAAVVTYTIGMAVFTIIMGNAFAAFPVMTAGIGLPLIVTRFGGSVTIMAAIGMLSGFCGTLMTPMAANFNIVPTALLEIADEYAVIKRQLPTALMILAINTLIMYTFVYRH